MRPSAHRASRSLLRDTRGATITEYAIMLFLVAVVAGSGFRFFGGKVKSGIGETRGDLGASDVSSASPSSAGAEGAGGGGTGVTTSHGAKGGGGGGGEGFGGARVATTPQEGTSLAKFAMIALGVIGGAAAFFAAVKGKTAR